MSDTVMMVDDGAKSKEDGCSSNDNDKKMNLEETWTNMVMRKLLRPTRYFDPPDEAGSMTDSSCDSCEEQEDTTPPRKRCFLCASFEHVGEQCSMGHDSCPNDGSICLKCGGMGHDMSLCKYEYTEDDLKDVQCYVCKGFGHMCCVGACDSLSWAVSCYKCGRLGHVGLGCGRHYEEPPTCWGKRDCSSRDSSSRLAAKKRRRLEKALATSAAIRERLEKKKQMKLEEEQERHSTLDESNGKMEKNGGNFEKGSTSHESNGKKNDGNLEQHSTLDESNGKTKKDKVTKEEDERPYIPEKSNEKICWITEDLVVGQHQEAEFSH
ncbi:unnamed protein product [Eruca vesicaria subsp. sativa]|uniref:CCHC-type domain-containing protein n=1 Tax=Eruca vesicaria subsp. sativa TaxID=29727 RepID=A0ABC8LZ74_ERUVS|nr:unnamed protein product [Eruca vesicaria subsp. sativa]